MTPSFPTFDVAEIAEEAAERAGVEFRSGYMLRSARRSIELLSIEWGNRGLNLWTVETGVINLTKGVEEYVLPDDTIDLIEHGLRYWNLDSGKPTDFPLARMSLSDYGVISAKFNDGRPTSIHIKRRIHPSILLWPVPDRDDYYQLIYARLRRMASVGSGGAGAPELPFRFLPAMIAGLAFYLALKSTDPGAQQRVPMLKAAYEEQFTLASDEDRDRASVKWVPWSYRI
jgi:hypothetical protein